MNFVTLISKSHVSVFRLILIEAGKSCQLSFNVDDNGCFDSFSNDIVQKCNQPEATGRPLRLEVKSDL
jgi:hypothetical protein